MNKLGVSIVIIVITLGIMGTAYATWSDNLSVQGDINTATLCWKFASARMLDTVSPGNPPVYFPTYTPDFTCSINGGFPYVPGKGYFWPSDKNVGWGEYVIGGFDDHSLTITLHNAYPCYFNEIGFYVYNCGTLPIRVQSVDVLDNNGDVIGTFDNHDSINYLALDLGGPEGVHDGLDDIEIQYGDNFGAQIHPGPSYLEFSYWIHVLQPAPQDSNLTFSLLINAVQWNEYVQPTH